MITSLSKLFLPVLIVVLFSAYACEEAAQPEAEHTLKSAFEDKFLFGAALNDNHINRSDTRGLEILNTHFNSIVAENVMKSGPLQPNQGRFEFTQADRFIELGMEGDFHIVGHTLIWHSQAPNWFFSDQNGQDVSAEVLKERMRNHIHTVVGRYKGKVKGWDVVNEAIMHDGSYRNSKFFQILGEDYIKFAFQFAQEADPNAELYYNDYSMANPGKRAGVVRMVRWLKDQGVKIDGIGMQGHVGLEYPTIQEFERSVIAYAALGVTVMITEFDLNVLPSPNSNMGADVDTILEYNPSLNPFTNGLPPNFQRLFDARYLAFFKVFLDHHDKISRVTIWGIQDGDSWLNNWPIRGRTNYPLLFNRDYTPKAVVDDIIKLALTY